MNLKAKRRIADTTVWVVTGMALVMLTGQTWVSILLLPFGLWNFYDGYTCRELYSERR
jgi:hypothetical protein